MNGITELDPTHQTIYAFARCEQWLRDFSETHGIPCDVLTQRVAALLHASTGGEVLGLEDSLSPLSGDMPTTTGSETMEQVEVDERPHRKAQVRRKKHSPIHRAAVKAAKAAVACVLCDMVFKDRKTKQKHYYYVHGAGMTSPKAKPYQDAVVGKKGRAPRQRRKLECKVCHQMIPNIQMGNHMRYAHQRVPAPSVVQRAVEAQAIPRQVTDAMAQYKEAVALEPANGAASSM